MSGFDNMMRISASGMAAERFRLNVISSNLANQNTTRTPEGGPYRRRDVVFEAAPPAGGETAPATAATGTANRSGKPAMGVKVVEVVTDPRPPIKKYQPDHPDADASGYVSYPDINTFEEMVNMLSATRSYEANSTIMKNAREMMVKTIDLLK
jgi:flagellar basal-body rod protein FlgC